VFLETHKRPDSERASRNERDKITLQVCSSPRQLSELLQKKCAERFALIVPQARLSMEKPQTFATAPIYAILAILPIFKVSPALIMIGFFAPIPG
jgi:hypothetical protein